MEQFQKVSSIGRPIDPRYPTNMAIAIYSVIILLVMLVFRLISGEGFLDAGWQALLAMLSIFLVWAFGRELDPEEPLSAFVGVVFMTIALFVLDAQYSLLALYYMMSLSRIVARTVGVPANLTDSMVLLIFTGIVSFVWSWVYALISMIAFALDSILPNPKRQHLLFAGLSLVMMIVAFILQPENRAPILPEMPYLVAIIVAGIIFIPLILRSKVLTVTGDISRETLMPIRVQATQLMILIFGYLVALWHGNEGVIGFLPLWLTIVGVSLFPLIKPFLPDWNLEKRRKSPAA